MTQGQQKPVRIDVYDPTERARWAQAFGISEAKLRDVVRRFGTSPPMVRASLGLPPA